MRPITFGFLLLWLAGACPAQSQQALCPRHIETPSFPWIARTAHLFGKVTLTVTVNAEGNVTDVEAASNDPASHVFPLLQKSAMENLRHWTFAKPPTAPYSDTIVYDYEIDASLPPDDGQHPITKVTFDLPSRVTILTNARLIDTDRSRKRN
ncbi:MAG: energy transducer TonB [Candidatus Acidiferrales bacterium]